MRQYIWTACVMFLCAVTSVHAERVFLDNHEVQQYRGRLGHWVVAGSKKELINKIRKYKSGYSQVIRINSSTEPGSHVFIPFSDDYIRTLRKSGHKRVGVDTGARQFIWPLVRERKITSSFGMRKGHLHTGMDISAGIGEPVIAAMDGRVVSACYSGGHGKSIYLEHRGNYFTRYSHNSVILVRKNEMVKKGQVIGLVGSTGNSTGNHLHFEIRYRHVPLNPVDFLPEPDDVKKICSGR